MIRGCIPPVAFGRAAGQSRHSKSGASSRLMADTESKTPGKHLLI
jgi:hypothetical protein